LGENREVFQKTVQAVVATYCQDGVLNHIDGKSLPSRDRIVRIFDALRQLLFPGFVGTQGVTRQNENFHVGGLLDAIEGMLSDEVFKALCCTCERQTGECSEATCREKAVEITAILLGKLPELRVFLAEDVRAAFEGDPAAASTEEVVMSYPFVLAITAHRIAHILYELKVPMIPRIINEHAHCLTGIDIHPGASIGRAFFIDHGTGVVIGETTTIGDNAKIYQGVTLGALSIRKDPTGRAIRGEKRHPTIGNNVTIYAGATILGGNTVIGEGAVIGGNVWLTTSVEPEMSVTLGTMDLTVRPRRSGPRSTEPKSGAAEGLR